MYVWRFRFHFQSLKVAFKNKATKKAAEVIFLRKHRLRAYP